VGTGHEGYLKGYAQDGGCAPPQPCFPMNRAGSSIDKTPPPFSSADGANSPAELAQTVG